MERYEAARARLISSARPGIEAARELSELTDEAVRELARAASSFPKGRWALVALGGWGAGAMLPASDLDILVLAEASGANHKPFIEAVLYPLWDAGLKVGHQARTPKEQVRAMREDTATMTAALTGRPLTGDTDWAASVLAQAARALGRRPDRALRRLRERDRPGSPFRLETNLKEDRGGRRDFDELVWSAAIVSGSIERRPDQLVAAGFLTAEEAVSLSDAEATIAAARWILQREGFGDRMTLDSAELLSDAEGVQHALATTAGLLDRVRSRLAGGAEPFPVSLESESLFRALEGGPDSLPMLEDVAFRGGLDKHFPEYARLMTARRPGIGHELTVGAHSLATAALLATLGTQDDALARSRASVTDWKALVVAALAHDSGKLDRGPGHADRSAPYAHGAARRLGLSEESAQDAADLVRLHLVLPEAAMYADMDDEDAVLSIAAKIGRRELVAPLHLLTAADSLATGPSTWNGWTAALLTAVASRLDAALSDNAEGAGLVTRAQAVREATLSSLSAEPGDVRDFVGHAPLRYLASRDPAEVAKHARVLSELARVKAPDRISISVSPGVAPGTYDVTIAAHDRTELLARIAGALALAGLDILSADAYRFGHGLVLDAFTVTSATLRPVDSSTWNSFERYLKAAVKDRLELETRLQERRRHYPAAAQGPVTIETDASPGYHTIVRVTAPDRPGLLYDLARAVSSSGLDIRWAKAATVDGMAIDSFHITGPDGSAVTDPGTLGHLAMYMRQSA
ncbi:MAG: HD domain-containing protein [Coriobacteriales bacterium]|nr:HD domain-containing protein [Coriobacteriales bacterium]